MRIAIENGKLIVELSTTEKICSCRRVVEVPVQEIERIVAGTPEPRIFEFRAPGTFIPGFIKAGTFYTRTGKEFWYVKRSQKQYVTIELSERAPFRRLVFGLGEGDDAFIKQLGRKLEVPAAVEA